jgi:hyaluronoglucosaminidase
MPLRGVIEGFYNQPFPHTERVRLLRFLAQNNFNYYIYAPKNDPYHRQLWRESYPEDEQKNFQELVQAANATGITFNFGISPGLNINYNDPAEVGKLESKLKQMFDLGIRAFTLCLDDIPDSNHANEKMARDQVKVVNELSRFLKALDPNCQLFFVPTVYCRDRP